MEKFLAQIVEICTNAGSKILLALAVFLVGRIIIRKLVGMIGKIKSLDKVDPSVRTFTINFFKVALYVILIVSIISILGVPMASVITVLASAGVAVGMALQGALSNIAGGIMIMAFRPFNVGDYVITAGTEGFVKEINLFYTVLDSIDNKKITVPNGALMNATVSNCSAEATRRVDLVFACAKGEDVKAVQQIMVDVMNANPKVIKEPAPFARISGGTNEAMQITVRAWCASADYWDVYFDLNQDIVIALGKAGVKAPAVRIITES